MTRKITRGLARIREGLDECLHLGNLEARRDWGHARDYVHAMWLMLQQPAPDDFVVATGEQHSVREFVEAAAMALGMALEWRGVGLEERGVDARSGKTLVRIDPRLLRPTEVHSLCGDATKIRSVLGWLPKTSFAALVSEMAQADLALAQEEARSRRGRPRGRVRDD